jgi:hypothetical protein
MVFLDGWDRPRPERDDLLVFRAGSKAAGLLRRLRPEADVPVEPELMDGPGWTPGMDQDEIEVA